MGMTAAPAVAAAFPDAKVRADAVNDDWGWAVQGAVEEQLSLLATRPTGGDGGLGSRGLNWILEYNLRTGIQRKDWISLH